MNNVQVAERQWWEQYFSVNGGWEKNGGRDQSLVFARAFTEHLELDRRARLSILDVGCALGDALRHFSTVFPNASLYGIDFTQTAIERCQKELAGLAVFETRDMLKIQGRFDLIYISNVLEHFTDFAARARKLARHCQRLCILVPYFELKDYRTRLVPDPSEHHQHTFEDNSFDFLIQEGLAVSVRRYIFSCYPAWGWSPREHVRHRLGNLLRFFKGQKRMEQPRQIFYDIRIRSDDTALTPPRQSPS